MISPLLRCACGLLAGLLLATAAGAEPPEVRLPPPGTDGWRPLALPGVERATRWEPFQREGLRGVRAISRCSASALALPLEGVDLERTPWLEWRWRVLRGLDIEDERSKRGDDFAARVYVTFPLDPRHTSTWERLRHRLAQTLFGEETPAAALNYVWTSREPAGARWDNPFARESKMISLGPAPPGVWREARVHVRDDYEALFGHPPPAPSGVVLLSDSDNSCREAEAEFADFRWAGDILEPSLP